jgi:hypothetical protein
MERRLTVLLAGLLGLALWSDLASAHRRHHHHHHHHHHHGARVVFYSAPLYVPRYFYPAPVYVAPRPVTYIEQPQPDSQAYWYYCHEAQAYYPYVQACPGGWQRVAPQPAPR